MYLCVYTICSNVKVVAFGKAVLGMVEALETLLGDHIVGGVASVPRGAMEVSPRRDTLHSVPREKSKVR